MEQTARCFFCWQVKTLQAVIYSVTFANGDRDIIRHACAKCTAQRGLKAA